MLDVFGIKPTWRYLKDYFVLTTAEEAWRLADRRAQALQEAGFDTKIVREYWDATNKVKSFTLYYRPKEK